MPLTIKIKYYIFIEEPNTRCNMKTFKDYLFTFYVMWEGKEPKLLANVKFYLFEDGKVYILKEFN